MNETRKPAAQSLLETGTLVRFRVVDTLTEPSPDKENVFVRADLVFDAASEFVQMLKDVEKELQLSKASKNAA